MNWITLDAPEQINTIKELSNQRPQVIFKHSTRCSISSMVKNRLERSDSPQDIDFYYLDLLAHRPLSQSIADTFDVYHESPQVLLIVKGECIYDESHHGISMDELVEQARQLS
ncbi:MAG: bacillithiol system redox-active protein YtxJ [Chitinophagaceae bacterium]|jgi:bacillithiol system protein YtxJ|nr:bacillithiol system redox-active protein YtxJ [Chitinophagaceae bacterium]